MYELHQPHLLHYLVKVKTPKM